MHCHWKKIRYNCYRLVVDGEVTDFDTYGALYAYCQHHNINAQQA